MKIQIQMKKLQNNVINITYKIKSRLLLFYNKNISYCYIIPFLFKTMGKEIPADAEPIIQLNFNLFILSLICLGCFINLCGYFISLYLINKYDVENRFPKYSKYIRYYEKSNLFFIYLEMIICVFALLMISLLTFSVIAMYIIK
jgi:hypothetical protein